LSLSIPSGLNTLGLFAPDANPVDINDMGKESFQPRKG
jgi:hypothetical protein